ncbi:MAG: DUF1805 domain-containing protein [Lentisphaerae bacterium]|jgi:uncharacterized protein YunC (DUF1805 family)|nr:DUF1805 domain-containing protein [Lentisphaerota bacterium]MBT5609792.1 DUF1805 domain-containing protein [Lentisphaerota bacterium]MBT7054043.1 DUF1805 domain-containing protein [Lentisphaerota bacterium]MBT7846951.1 DUF1805 domain-containing protein [Lentisphaerota bacterium]
MLETAMVKVDGGVLQGIRVGLPNAAVLMLVGEKGFVGCGYFDPAVADKVSHALAVVSGVSSFDDMLSASVKTVSAKAAELGITVGMSGADAATLLV